jgi:cation transport ATPase
MDYAYPKSKRFYEIVISLLGWFAIIAQFYLQINSERASITELISRFFSYFTILTNILVALSCLLQLLAPGSAWGRFFSRSTTLTAITVYIVIV